MALTMILGDQLHRHWLAPSPLQLGPHSRVLMIEDHGVAKHYRYHQLRLLHTFVAMRSFRDALIAQAIPVRYHDLPASIGTPFWSRLLLELNALPEADRLLQVAEIADSGFEAALKQVCQQHAVPLQVLPSPAFLESAADSRRWFEGQRRPRMASFYQRQRKRLGLLLEADGSPCGGQWSFDAENRRKLPKGYQEPPRPAVAPSRHEAELRPMIRAHFADHPGELGALWMPYDHAGAEALIREDPMVRSGCVDWKLQGWIGAVGDLNLA